MTDKCKKEIREYVEKKGWENYKLFDNNTLLTSYFEYSDKGIKLNFKDKWEKEPEEMDKYLLEFIGHILRKHNITEIEINYDSIDDTDVKYQSTDWKFKTIKKIL